MEENTVGFRFHPTDEELINDYLKKKIQGESSEIEAINEININDYDPDPDSLRSLSRIQSEDPTWYFFAPVIYTTAKKTSRKRITKSGSWKPSGEDRLIKDKSGNTIGLKKTLVYKVRGASTKRKKKEKNHGVKVKKKNHKGKGKKNPWVMHEYQIQSWSHPDKESYVICKIKYKGEEDGEDVIIPSIGETSQSSLASDSNTVTTVITTPPELSEEENGLSMNDLTIPLIEQENLDDDLLQQAPPSCLPEVYDEFWDGFDPTTFFSDNNNDDNDENTDQELILQQDHNDYRPKKPLSGIIDGYNTDSDDDDDDAESISVTSYQGTLSPVDSDEETLSLTKDLQTSSVESSINGKNPETEETADFEESYVICKIKYKGEEDEDDIIIPSIGETSQSSLASDSNTVTTVITTPPELSEEENGLSMNDLTIPLIEQENLDDDLLQQAPPSCLPEVYDEFWDGFDPTTFFSDNNNDDDENTDQELILQQDHNDYRPKKPLSGIIDGYNTDTDDDDDDDDAESISVTSYQGTLSPVDSDEETLSSTIDLQTFSDDSSINGKNPETEKEEAMEKKPEKKKKNLKYVYVMDRIIRLILLVVFGSIVSVLSTVKT